jgi:hypothetical protein
MKHSSCGCLALKRRYSYAQNSLEKDAILQEQLRDAFVTNKPIILILALANSFYTEPRKDAKKATTN